MWNKLWSYTLFKWPSWGSWSQSWEPLLSVFVWVLTGVFQCVPTFFWCADFRVGVHLQAKPPSVCLSPLSVCFSAISVFLLLPLLQSFIYIPKPHPYRAAQLLPLKMYLALTDEKFKESDGGFQQLMKGKRYLACCVSQMDVGIVAVAWVAGTRDYRQNLCTKAYFNPLARARTHLGSHGTHGNERMHGKDKGKPQPAEPLSYLWQNQNHKMHHSNIYFGMSSFNSVFFPPSLLALGQYAGTKHGFQKKEKKVFSVWRQIGKFIPLPRGVKLIKTYYLSCHMGTYLSAHNPFLLKEKKNCRCSVTYTL